MRIRFRYSLTTLLLLPLLVGVGIKWYRGPHEYSLIEQITPATLIARNEPDPFVRTVLAYPRTITFRAYRNLDGSLTRHGLEVSTGPRGDKMHTGYRGGQRNGAFRYWDDQGELVCQGSFENGEQSGEWVYYRFGIAYQRIEFDHDQQHEIENRYDLDRLAERRVRKLGTGEILLTTWHPSGQKRLEGRFVKERPAGKWRWWNSTGGETRSIIFHDGIPQEFVGRPGAKRFFDASLDLEFQGVPLGTAVSLLNQQGFLVGIECRDEIAREVENRQITTMGSELKDGLGFYLALRDAGLTMDVRDAPDGRDIVVVLPADEP